MKITYLLPALMALMLLGGCMQMSSDTVIEKDGSGLIQVSFSSSIKVAEALEQMKELDTDMGDSDMSFEMSRDDIEEFCSRSGVKLKSYKAIDGADRRGAEFSIEFDNIDELQGIFGGSGNALFQLENGDYLLKTVEVEMEADPDESDEEDFSGLDEEAFDPAAMGKTMEVMGTLMAAANELEISLRMTVPGEILEHNAQRVEGRTCIWEINSDNMMMMGDMEPEIRFSGKGLKIKAPKL